MNTLIQNLLNPSDFFRKTLKENNYKKPIINMFIFSLYVFIMWFLTTIYKINFGANIFLNNSPIYSVFSSFNSLFILNFVIYLFADILLIVIMGLIIVIIIKFILSMLQIKLSFQKVLSITAYSLFPLYFMILFTLVFHIINFEKVFLPFRKYIFILTHYLPNFINLICISYFIALIIIGVKVVADLSIKKYNFILLMVMSLLVLVNYSIIFLDMSNVYKDIYSYKNETYKDFSVKIGSEVIFTKNNIKAICTFDECSGVNEDNSCFKTNDGYSCDYNFKIVLDDASAQKFAKVTKSLQNNNDEYISEDLSYYLNGAKIRSTKMSSELASKPLTFTFISGTGLGKTKEEAKTNALINMEALQAFLMS